MWFEGNEVYLEILIGGYTDRPWYFKTEHMGINALECQVTYNNEETERDFVMWDEILQTEEIVTIRDGLEKCFQEQKRNSYFTVNMRHSPLAFGSVRLNSKLLCKSNIWKEMYENSFAWTEPCLWRTTTILKLAVKSIQYELCAETCLQFACN